MGTALAPQLLGPDRLRSVSFDELLRTSDFVMVHCALNDETRHMFNATAFAKMKRSAIFINVARGEVVEQNHLYDALKSGQSSARSCVRPPDCARTQAKSARLAWTCVTRSRCLPRTRCCNCRTAWCCRTLLRPRRARAPRWPLWPWITCWRASRGARCLTRSERSVMKACAFAFSDGVALCPRHVGNASDLRRQ